ncbi:hypothetical protein NHX12_012223 [Muraenolepis orangiensis]|uniref:Uncharacterized protein n=1 Tax=Muraenolepis orangiensis TaxID=630683 RepID=A0A9Q0DBG6_9TELE|nr:hypothetical protein NHX12_012223 [Muraenolepis orangiensis]
MGTATLNTLTGAALLPMDRINRGGGSSCPSWHLLHPPSAFRRWGGRSHWWERGCAGQTLLYCRDFHWDLLSIRGPEEQEIIDEMVARANFPLSSHLLVGLPGYRPGLTGCVISQRPRSPDAGSPDLIRLPDADPAFTDPAFKNSLSL